MDDSSWVIELNRYVGDDIRSNFKPKNVDIESEVIIPIEYDISLEGVYVDGNIELDVNPMIESDDSGDRYVYNSVVRVDAKDDSKNSIEYNRGCNIIERVEDDKVKLDVYRDGLDVYVRVDFSSNVESMEIDGVIRYIWYYDVEMYVDGNDSCNWVLVDEYNNVAFDVNNEGEIHETEGV